MPAAEKAALAQAILERSRGACAALAMSHTASRVLQAAAKAAPPAARAALLAEVTPDLVPLAKSSYGHFLVVRLAATADRAGVAGEGKGGMVCRGVDTVSFFFVPLPSLAPSAARDGTRNYCVIFPTPGARAPCTRGRCGHMTRREAP